MLVSLLSRSGPVVARVLRPLAAGGVECLVLDIPRAHPIPTPLVGQRPGDVVCWPAPCGRPEWLARIGDVLAL